MIALALALDPDVLIADEPTTALDVTIQAQILRLLADLQREFKMGLILITHDLGIVARIADHVAVMYAGEIVEHGTASEIFEQPLHPYTRGLLQCIPVPGRSRRGTKLGAIPGIVPTPIGPLTACQFRNRCPQAIPACAEAPVPLFGEPSGHAYRCIVAEATRLAPA